MKFPNEPSGQADFENRIFVWLSSQVSLEVSGENIFRTLQERILKWAFDPQRNLKGIPDGAWEGKSFEIDADNSEGAAAVALDDLKYYAFRLRERLKDRNRIWTTEVGLAERSADEAIFGCRLICSQRGDSEPAPRSIPRFVRGMAFKQNARLDGRRTSPDPWIVNRENDVSELISFLESPRRKHPVVVFALPEESGDVDQTIVPVRPFIRRTVGFVHTAVLTSEASFALTDKLGREFSVFRQAVRTYNPGFDPESGLFSDHPMATAARVREWENTEEGAFVEFLVHQTLRLMRPRSDLEREHPPFQQVKRLSVERARRAAKAAGQSDTELLALAEEEVSTARAEAQESLDLAVNAVAEKEQALTDLREMKARYMALQSRVDALQAQSAGGNRQETEIPDSLDELQVWAENNLSGSVELHSRALRGAKDAEYEDVSLIYKALLLLRDFYVPMRRNGGAELKSAFDNRCRELGIEEQPAFAGTRAAEQGDAYFVRFGQRRIELDRHLKKGTSREPRHCFRLYFFWDETTRQAVVGWLPSHLATRAS
ncbi:hypothetical protein [Nitratireductor sp. XY-223]|uniref:hypothetical protein n=1 Tax=Nitratireductor sp. XY-223 TaxID=2561926 RepID=UPI0010AA53BE|nr:hypothetical protein [Nitratireductor sp. XY-223]